MPGGEKHSAGEDAPAPMRPVARAVTGVVLVLAGSLALVGLVYISNSRAPGAEHAMMAIGLPGSVMLSGIAQCAVIFGLWFLWRAAHRARR